MKIYSYRRQYSPRARATSEQNTYTFRIAESLAKSNTIEYKNIAVRGAQTSDFLEQQVPQIIEFRPDIVTISIGANDATHLISQKKILENYRKIIQKLSEETSAQIYITNIANFNGASLLPPPFIKFIEWRSQKINPAILKLESDRVKVINIHDFGWENYPDIKTIYSADHFHPNDIGYTNWYNAFWDTITKNK
ncbi:TPA: hypothetical protein DCG61_00010 [Patescibacteria group bacterium]|nr:hypothetical protein [Patescibacteria group bacterium]